MSVILTEIDLTGVDEGIDGVNVLNAMRAISDHRVAGMVTYPLDEILPASLVRVICEADDWDRVEY